MYQKTVARFNTISFTIITGMAALLPFFFLPATISGLGAVKGVLLYAGVFLAFSFWLVAQFLEGSLRIPRHRVLLGIALWIILALVSALASANVTVSLWGRGFATDSFATVLVLSLYAFLIATFARDQHKLVKLFLAAFAGSVITVLLQVIFYATHTLPFVTKYLGHIASQGTLVGSWVDFAYFVIFTFLISLLMYEVLAPKGFFKFVSLFAMILSLLVLVFLNFRAAWVITIVSALLVFVYKSSVERSLSKFIPAPGDETALETPQDEEHQRFPMMSFVSLLVGLFFFLSSGSIGASIAQFAGVTFTDIRPSFATTTQVMRAELSHNPFFGAGAGRYMDSWNLYHPVDINQTMFWNTSFETGFSSVQSLLTTNGILPVLALLFVLVVSLLHGFKLFNYQFPDRFTRFIAVTALIMLLAFVILIFLASPGIVLTTFGFMYLGLLLGVSTLVGKTKLMAVNYLRDPRTSFFAILILVIAAMAGFSAVYFSGNRFASIVVYNRAVTSDTFEKAAVRIDRAIGLSINDIYLRTRTALYTSQFTTLANKENADKAQLQTNFTAAEQSASAAVQWDNTSASNWLALSQVYQLVVGGENEEPYKNAKQAADEAQKRNPKNPVYVLNQAQLAVIKKDTEGALAYIEQALVLKADYLDAYILRAQIKRAGGDSTAVKNEITAYTKAAPFNDQGYLLLGQTLLDSKEYQAALEAFARAKELNPGNPSNYLQYISTLEVMGNRTQAITELKAFQTRFPAVEGVADQITRIETGSATVVTPEEAPAETESTSTPEKKTR